MNPVKNRGGTAVQYQDRLAEAVADFMVYIKAEGPRTMELHYADKKAVDLQYTPCGEDVMIAAFVPDQRSGKSIAGLTLNRAAINAAVVEDALAFLIEAFDVHTEQSAWFQSVEYKRLEEQKRVLSGTLRKWAHDAEQMMGKGDYEGARELITKMEARFKELDVVKGKM